MSITNYLRSQFVESIDAIEHDEGTFGAAEPRFDLPPVTNYATNEDVKKQVDAFVNPVMEWTRTNRVALEEEWRSILRMELMLHDKGRKYFGRSDAYIPLYAKALQTTTSALSRALFPSDDYMDVAAMRDEDAERAKSVKAYLKWEFEKVAGVRRNIKPFLRQLSNFGNSVIKYWYHKRCVYEGRNKRRKLVNGKEITVPGFTAMNYDGLRISPRNMLYWYIYPTTAESMDDATVVFEDMDVPRAVVQEKVRSGEWLSDALNASIPPNHQINQYDLHTNAFGLVPPSTPILGGNSLGDVLVLTELYTYLKLPNDAYVDGEEKGCPVPVKLVMAGYTCVSCIRNPFFHQKPPYLFSRTNVTPGMVYGYWSGRLCRSPQYLVNDFANQTNDVGVMGMNPIVIYNPGTQRGPISIFPGAKWANTDTRDGIRFDRPPVELSQYGMQFMSQYSGMMQDFAGAPPILQGTNTGKAAKTATGAQILQRNAQQPLQDVVEDIELEAMVPLLYGTWLNAQQYREAKVMARVAGESIEVSPEDLAIDCDLTWSASSQAVQQAQRAQSAIQLLQAVMPFAQYINQIGYTIDPVPLIKKVATDGFGFRGMDKFITGSIKVGQGGVPGQPLPNTPPGGMSPEQQDNIRSALEQIGVHDDMVPGEGEDFASVRDNADSIAGMAGGNNAAGGYGE